MPYRSSPRADLSPARMGSPGRWPRGDLVERSHIGGRASRKPPRRVLVGYWRMIHPTHGTRFHLPSELRHALPVTFLVSPLTVVVSANSMQT
jgi:hypothetical protein